MCACVLNLSTYELFSRVKTKRIFSMEKLSQLLNASLASRMILVGYDYDVFSAMNDSRVSK